MAQSDILSQWGPVFEQVGSKYGLDPDILKAIALQENVNPAYNNPLGRSSATGVLKYSADQGQSMVDRQAQLLTNPNGPYKDFVKSGSIYDLAKVYSPVGAKNDINGTNASEAPGIIGILNRIKGGSVTGGTLVAAGTGTTSVPTLASTSTTAPMPAAPGVASATTPGLDTTTGLDPATLDRIRQLKLAMALSGGGAQAGGSTNIGGQLVDLANQVKKGGISAGWWPAPRATLVNPSTSA